MNFLRRSFVLGLPVAAFAALVAGRRTHAGTGDAGTISRLAGSVTVLRGGAGVAAAVGLGIKASDTLRAGADGRAQVTFSDGSMLTVGPASEVAVTFFAPEAGEPAAAFDLVSGIVRMTVNKATGWGKFEVRTTTAVAAVRGTDYLVDAGVGKSAVFVAEGRVAVSSRAGAGTVVIRDGQGVDITSAFVPLVVKIWGAKRRDAALARVTFP